MDSKLVALENKLADLERELVIKEQDLLRYKNELVKANKRISDLIQQVNIELKQARYLHKILVPTTYPNIVGVDFSTRFVSGGIRGGDYFDIFEHEDKMKFGVLVAASSGYTMSSLLLQALLKMTGQIEARKGAAPHLIVADLAKELIPNISEKDSASLFYGVLDRRTFELQVASFGKNLALHFDSTTGRYHKISSQGAALAKGFSPSGEGISLTLNPKDRLIICSEGVTRLVNDQGETFGEERVLESLLKAPKGTVHDLRQEIFFKIEKFAGSNDFPEDLTVVVIEVKEGILRFAKH